MNPPVLSAGLLTLLLAAAPCALAQNFGNTSTKLRDLTTAELFKPPIPSDEVGDPNPNAPANPGDRPINDPTIGVPRPVYLVMRYYSCQPWYPIYVRDVVSDAVTPTQYKYVIDAGGATAPGDNVDAQIVTDINHPAYGLYCLRIAVVIPYDLWQTGLCKRFYVRWGYNAPYYCWLDHWWYYWRRPCISFPLTGGQQVPPVTPAGTGTATICRQPGTNIFTWSVTFQGLTSGVNAAHIHGPAGPGQNAGVVIPFDTSSVNGQTSGTFSGTFTATAAEANMISSGQGYVNVHTNNNGGGEIRGQLTTMPSVAVWCPWGPSWWPWMGWDRIGDVWGLTISHPYCYAWHPSYIPRPFCLYGLQHYHTPLGATALAVRSPAQDRNSEYAVPLNDRLSLASLAVRPVDQSDPNNLLEKQWTLYKSVLVGGQPLRPNFRYWPYTPYCSRWYWWRSPAFTLFRYNPPVIRFGLWQGAGGAGPDGDLPDQPLPNFPGTVGCFTSRSMIVIPADLNGDGFVNTGDQAHARQQTGTRAIDSFFDVFTELEP